MPKAMFEDIYRDVKQKIQDDVYPYQSFLPPEKDLVAVYSCSRNTVRRALQMLADDAYVQPLHGKGVRVIWQRSKQPTVGSLVGVESFEEYAKKNGRVPSTEVKLFETLTCDQELSARTGFEEGAELTHVIRVRSLNGEACQVDHNFFLESAVPGLTPRIAAGSIYRYIETELGMRILTSSRSITVELSTDMDRMYLDLGPYSCVAITENRVFNSNGVMFEYTQTRSHPKTFNLHVVSRR
ncbi:MAG: UTRA domain-containing protein [Atopobiaceae bacterium]|nr:GntR family transcriptional regulator [Atopobiaceae bacterium]